MSHQNPLLAQLGVTVRSLRKGKGWSRRDLADQTGISERFLADVEAGAANPSLLRLKSLADALDIDLPALVTGAPTPPRHIALLGLRGAGKSSVGSTLAQQLGLLFVELDSCIESETGLQLGEIFLVHGEAYYREAERTVLSQKLAGPPSVLAVGGGLVTDASSLKMLRTGARTVWLRARPEDHWERVLAQGDTRPMADNERAFADLRRILAEREPLYRLAELVVDTSGHAVDAVVELVRRELVATPA